MHKIKSITYILMSRFAFYKNQCNNVHIFYGQTLEIVLAFKYESFEKVYWF